MLLSTALLTATINTIRVFGSFDAQTVICPVGFDLLSCGMMKDGSTGVSYYVSSVANDSVSCACVGKTSRVRCIAWCTNALQGFEIRRSLNVASGTFVAKCSPGKQVRKQCECSSVKFAQSIDEPNSLKQASICESSSIIICMIHFHHFLPLTIVTAYCGFFLMA